MIACARQQVHERKCVWFDSVSRSARIFSDALRNTDVSVSVRRNMKAQLAGSIRAGRIEFASWLEVRHARVAGGLLQGGRQCRLR
jgi:hypothetical protein